MSEIHFNPYIFKRHSKSELIKLYAGFYTLRPKLDLYTYLCLHFKKEGLQFISDCFVQMVCCPDLELEITDETATKGSVEYAIVYPAY